MASRLLLLLNVLILVSVLAGGAVVGLVGLTAIQSVSGLSVGTLSTSTSGGVTQISIPVTLRNGGYLPLSGVMLSANVTDGSNDVLVQGGAGPVDVAPGQTSDLTIKAALDTGGLPASVVKDLATTSQDLKVSVHAATSVAPFVSLRADAVGSLHWGAPVSNLVVGTPELKSVNGTSVTLSVPVSFANDNQYVTVSGTGTMTVMGPSNEILGGGSLQVNAQPGSSFSSDATIVISLPQALLQHLFFNNDTLSYVVGLAFTSGGLDYTRTQNVNLNWGAPVAGLKVGTFTVAPLNSSAERFSVPLNFSDKSSFLSLSGTLTGVLKDKSGDQVGTLNPLSLAVSHGELFSGTLTGFVQASAAGGSSYTLSLTFADSRGSFTTEVTINA